MAVKVLVVEDDNFLVTAYRTKLVNAGLDVQVATDGEEAMKALKSFNPDVILLDLVMPKKDGMTTLTEIKADDKLKNIPVVITSNLGQAEDIEKAKSLGAADFVVKSNMSMEDIISKVKSLAG